MDPVRNPYAPGAGQRPPELAGRDEPLDAFDVALERVVRGRPERSVLLVGLRGVGKTVLLGAMRSAAVRAGWGTGKLEARPDASLRRPLAAALHQAVRELGVPAGPSADHALGVVRSFAQRAGDAKARERTLGITVPAVVGRADSGDLELDLVELLGDLGGIAAEHGTGLGVFLDEMQDLGPEDVSALCAALHEVSQARLPVVVVGAGLPHLPGVLAAAKSYSERLFRYTRIDRLDRAAADSALVVPAREEGVAFDVAALDALYDATGGYPYFVQAYGKATWDLAPRSPVTADDVAVAAPDAEADLAVGFFGARFDRATPGERDYLRAMAELESPRSPDGSVATAEVATHLGRRPQSLSPARDALLKKGLVYATERGRVAFTVPHFGRYLRDHT